MSPEVGSAAPPDFPAEATAPETTPATDAMARKRLGTSGVARSSVSAAKATSKATATAGKLGRPPLAPVVSGPRARKPTEAMLAISQAVEEKRKRKAAAASTPKPATTATKGKSKATTQATPSPSSPAIVAPQRTAHEVIVEMPGPPRSATDVGIDEFMSQLDHSHHQGLDDLNFSSDEVEATRLAVEERRIALEEERMRKEKKLEKEKMALEREKLAKEREDADRNIMFMNPSTLDDKARAYWEIARARILARESGGGGGVDGGDGGRGDL